MNMEMRRTSNASVARVSSAVGASTSSGTGAGDHSPLLKGLQDSAHVLLPWNIVLSPMQLVESREGRAVADGVREGLGSRTHGDGSDWQAGTQ
jgi:hypothetical protein